ncbi:hypothetical protein O6H91_17G036400 [Diphasiastrum complanatum]|uniref:Uncharacterized protein n=3 Tax=Diphasiastrum complanatum TaxID=34168 RepID=A0ACC2B5V8_DIPCM|nr:hypothetical protein O6H91_17G036400 [Diphasiastrum complanatum]KAJ7525098.1 hypothetical protein O6H91_17G036400 [Diphasiastrum complanatum]KAJ7525099.1 hypothetical protein O6H91_17G036400 [Diphasiastrum complanatum]
MFKSQLQEFAQKAALVQPVYESFKEGPSHEPKFRASVSVNGNTYESPSGFATLKAAQHAAAKAALDGLLQSGCGAGFVPSPVHESGLCKNILQEHAQKSSLPLPVYGTVRSGQEHSPTFTSTVDIGGMLYSGGPAKNKKEAEIKAARTALIAIQAQSRSSGVALEALPDFAQGQLGSTNVINSSLPRNGLKKRGRDPKDGFEKDNGAKVKKEPLEESVLLLETKSEVVHDNNIQHPHTQENEPQVHALSCTSVSSSLGNLSVPVGSS